MFVVPPPTVACGLRTTNLRVGDEVELACTVQPTPTLGLTYTILDTTYTNIMSDGSERNISLAMSQPAFRYVEKVRVLLPCNVNVF